MSDSLTKKEIERREVINAENRRIAKESSWLVRYLEKLTAREKASLIKEIIYENM